MAKSHERSSGGVQLKVRAGSALRLDLGDTGVSEPQELIHGLLPLDGGALEIRAATNDIDRTLGKLLVPRSKVDDIRSRIISKESLLGASLGDVDPSASEALRDEIAASRRELDSLPVRHVEPWEHAHILQRAIETARERLLIVADLAGQRTVGQEFLDGIERACSRGVTCHIGFARELEGPASPQPWAALTRLAERLRSGLRVHRFDGKHPGTLIADGTWVSSEFPWLSHLDDMGLRAELGLAVTVPAAVDQAYTTAAALAEGRQA